MNLGSVLAQVDRACPVLLIHGLKDSLIPFENSKRLYDLLYEKRKEVEQKPGKSADRFIKLSKRKDCGHHNYFILNDVIVPISSFLQECKIEIMIGKVKRPYWASPRDNIETTNYENDIFYNC